MGGRLGTKLPRGGRRSWRARLLEGGKRLGIDPFGEDPGRHGFEGWPGRGCRERDDSRGWFLLVRLHLPGRHGGGDRDERVRRRSGLDDFRPDAGPGGQRRRRRGLDARLDGLHDGPGKRPRRPEDRASQEEDGRGPVGEDLSGQRVEVLRGRFRGHDGRASRVLEGRDQGPATRPPRFRGLGQGAGDDRPIDRREHAQVGRVVEVPMSHVLDRPDERRTAADQDAVHDGQGVRIGKRRGVALDRLGRGEGEVAGLDVIDVREDGPDLRHAADQEQAARGGREPPRPRSGARAVDRIEAPGGLGQEVQGLLPIEAGGAPFDPLPNHVPEASLVRLQAHEDALGPRPRPESAQDVGMMRCADRRKVGLGGSLARTTSKEGQGHRDLARPLGHPSFLVILAGKLAEEPKSGDRLPAHPHAILRDGDRSELHADLPDGLRRVAASRWVPRVEANGRGEAGVRPGRDPFAATRVPF